MKKLNDKEIKETFIALWDKIPYALAIVGEDKYFMYANPTYCKLVKYSELELQGMTYEEVTAPGDVKVDNANVQSILNGERTRYKMIKDYIAKDNKFESVVLDVSAVFVGDTFSHFIAMVEKTKIEVNPLPKDVKIDKEKTPFDVVRKNWQWLLVCLLALGVVAGKAIEVYESKKQENIQVEKNGS